MKIQRKVSDLDNLTNKFVDALRLVVPVNSQEIDGDAGKHDGEANTTNDGLGVKREDEQEGPEDQVNDGPNQADLEKREYKIVCNRLKSRDAT